MTAIVCNVINAKREGSGWRANSAGLVRIVA